MTGRPARRARGHAKAELVSRPPFEPGNTMAVTHGAYSPRLLEPRAAEIVAMLLANPSTNVYLSDVSYRPQVDAYAMATAAVERLSDFVLLNGDLNDDGEPSGASKLLLAWSKRQAEAAARLGLDPLSRSRLGKDMTGAVLDVAQIMQRIVEANHAVEANPDDG